jgi:hypothetical protein
MPATLRSKVIHHHDIAGPQFGDQHLVYPGSESPAIDRAIEHKRGHQTFAAQGAEEGGRMPVPVRRVSEAARAFRRASPGGGHVGAGPGFIQKHQALDGKIGLLGRPVLPCLGYVRAFLFGGMQ